MRQGFRASETHGRRMSTVDIRARGVRMIREFDPHCGRESMIAGHSTGPDGNAA
jgi:hypothetical protein